MVCFFPKNKCPSAQLKPREWNFGTAGSVQLLVPSSATCWQTTLYILTENGWWALAPVQEWKKPAISVWQYPSHWEKDCFFPQDKIDVQFKPLTSYDILLTWLPAEPVRFAQQPDNMKCSTSLVFEIKSCLYSHTQYLTFSAWLFCFHAPLPISNYRNLFAFRASQYTLGYFFLFIRRIISLF